jgi:hypothetical protein
MSTQKRNVTTVGSTAVPVDPNAVDEVFETPGADASTPDETDLETGTDAVEPADGSETDEDLDDEAEDEEEEDEEEEDEDEDDEDEDEDEDEEDEED